jgi:GT2 family glycosyltransferase
MKFNGQTATHDNGSPAFSDKQSTTSLDNCEPGPKVSIVLLNLNGYRDTHDCLESLRHVRYPNFDVILVDNASSDDSVLRLQKEFPEVKLLRSRENLGFSGGNNLGIENALDSNADYVLLLNNDTTVDPDFLGELVEVGQSDPRIGILGPKIFHYSDPKRIWYAGGYVKYGIGACRHLGQDQLDQEGKFARVEDTGFVTGCAMLIKSSLFREIGLLDPKLFLYWEDSDFCMRAKKVRNRLIFVPNAFVWHKISRTCGPESPFTLYLITRNQLAWVTKHVPFPYKPGALAWAFMKKLLKTAQLTLKDRASAVAVLAGIWAYLCGIYGPPPDDRPRFRW